MAPNKTFRTYGRNTSMASSTKSVDTVNNLFAINLTKRKAMKKKKKKTLKIKELPARQPNEALLKSEDSLKVNLEDTFDKIAKTAFNKVNFKDDVKNISTDNTDTDVSKSNSNLRFSVHHQILTPPLTRRRKQVKRADEKKYNKKKPEIFLQPEEASTIDVSLCIEKPERNEHFSKYVSLSYLQLSKDTSKDKEISLNGNLRNGEVFTCNKNERSAIISGAPLQNKPITEIIEESLEEIKNWDYKFPFNNNNNIVSSTPFQQFQGRSRRNSCHRRKIIPDVSRTRRFSESSLCCSVNDGTKKQIEDRAKMNVSDWKLKAACNVNLLKTSKPISNDSCNEVQNAEQKHITLRRRRISFHEDNSKPKRRKINATNDSHTHHEGAPKCCLVVELSDVLLRNSDDSSDEFKESSTNVIADNSMVLRNGKKKLLELNRSKFKVPCINKNMNTSSFIADDSSEMNSDVQGNNNSSSGIIETTPFKGLKLNYISKRNRRPLNNNSILNCSPTKPSNLKVSEEVSFSEFEDNKENIRGVDLSNGSKSYCRKPNKFATVLSDSSTPFKTVRNETGSFLNLSVSRIYDQSDCSLFKNNNKQNVNTVVSIYDSLESATKISYQDTCNDLVGENNSESCFLVDSSRGNVVENGLREPVVNLTNMNVNQLLENVAHSGTNKELVVEVTNMNLDEYLKNCSSESAGSDNNESVINLTELNADECLEKVGAVLRSSSASNELVVKVPNMNFDTYSRNCCDVADNPASHRIRTSSPFVNLTNLRLSDDCNNSQRLTPFVNLTRLQLSDGCDKSTHNEPSENNSLDLKNNTLSYLGLMKTDRLDLSPVCNKCSAVNVPASATKRITVRKASKENDNLKVQINSATPKKKNAKSALRRSSEQETNLELCSKQSNIFSTKISVGTPKKNCSELINDNNNSLVIIEDSLDGSKEAHQRTVEDPVDSISSCNQSKFDQDCFIVPSTPGRKLKPGKLWRRSLADIKRNSEVSTRGNNVNSRNTVFAADKTTIEDRLSTRLSIRVVPVFKTRPSTNFSSLENYAKSISLGYVSASAQNINDHLESSFRNLSVNEKSQLSCKRKSSATLICNSQHIVTAREVVLRRCGQTEPIPFQECYPSSLLKNCQKIGEGVYGEVFLYKNPNGGTTVMKVIPIEGDRIVNGDRQKKFEEIISEIVIALELSNLRYNKRNNTNAFSEVLNIRCVQGCYPARLLDLWDLFDENRGSENDCPSIFTEEQLYIVLELANGGLDLEAYLFTNASQALSVFKQTACALAIAENEFEFEHRDLHWGNILISTSNAHKKLSFSLDGKEITLATKGVQVAIIDFTLSRIMCEGVVIFNDLSADPDLFTAEGDYQFEIYKLMQKRNGNNWQPFEPFSNILWLHYTLDKMITAVRYKNIQSKLHREYIEKLTELKEEILSYNSVQDLVSDKFMS